MHRPHRLKAAFIVTTAAVAATALAMGCTSTVTNPPPCGDDATNCIQCPSAQPSDGDGCDSVGLECDYGDPSPCSDDSAYRATCGEDGSWSSHFIGSTCNPPPPPSCPSALPVNGDVCEVNVEGTPAEGCSYTVPRPCGEVGVEPQCVVDGDGVLIWQVTVPPCDGEAGACSGYEHPDLCASDSACRWLVPGCAEPGQGVPFDAGCFPASDCGSCDDGFACQTVIYNPCYNSLCDACGAGAQLCLPVP